MNFQVCVCAHVHAGNHERLYSVCPPLRVGPEIQLSPSAAHSLSTQVPGMMSEVLVWEETRRMAAWAHVRMYVRACARACVSVPPSPLRSKPISPA